MFGRKERAALASLDPLHRGLIEQRTLSAVLQPPAWRSLVDALVHPPPELRKAKHQVPPRTMEIVVPLVRLMAADVDDDAWLGLTVDLRGPGVPDKQGTARDLPPQPPALKVVEQLARDGWLAVDAQLRHGGRLRLGVVDDVRLRTITKRSASGKRKVKRRQKVTERVRVRLTPPKGIMPTVPGSTPRWLTVTTKDGKRPSVAVKAAYPIDRMQPAHQLQTILQVIGEAHRCVPWEPDDDAAAEPGAAS